MFRIVHCYKDLYLQIGNAENNAKFIHKWHYQEISGGLYTKRDKKQCHTSHIAYPDPAIPAIRHLMTDIRRVKRCIIKRELLGSGRVLGYGTRRNFLSVSLPIISCIGSGRVGSKIFNLQLVGLGWVSQFSWWVGLDRVTQDGPTDNSAFHDDDFCEALTGALLRLFGSHYRKLSLIVTLLLC